MSKHVIVRCAFLLFVMMICFAQVALLMCKLCGFIDWSWWIVMMPLWIDYALSILAGIAIAIYCVIICRKNQHG